MNKTIKEIFHLPKYWQQPSKVRQAIESRGVLSWINYLHPTETKRFDEQLVINAQEHIQSLSDRPVAIRIKLETLEKDLASVFLDFGNVLVGLNWQEPSKYPCDYDNYAGRGNKRNPPFWNFADNGAYQGELAIQLSEHTGLPLVTEFQEDQSDSIPSFSNVTRV